jgi:serine phosphatase RsbU (regulator of sigma subunit)
MSMIGNEQLTKIINEKGLRQPAAILDALHTGIRSALKQDRTYGETRDGMDIALYKLNLVTLNLEFAGANRPLWVLEDSEIKEIKANKQPIGGLQTDSRTPFTNHSIQLKKGCSVYTFTDGYADQFGGEKGKKFMLKNFERLLLEVKNKPMGDQKKIIFESFANWKANHEQVDDVLIIGIRV